MKSRLAGIVLMGALLTGFSYPGARDAASFEHEGQSVKLVKKEGYRPVPEGWVRHALSNHRYPYDLARLVGSEFPIYLLEQQIVSHYGRAVAVTMNGEVILFSGALEPDRAAVEETALHEVAHVLADRTMNDRRWEKYRALRGLGPEYRRNAALWHLRPSEVFAEDFAHLFGTEEARKAAWQFSELPYPTEVPGLREFFVSLVDLADRSAN